MLTIRELFDDYLTVLGIHNADYSPESARTSALADIRAALQLMQMAGPDYYCRSTEEIALVAEQGVYELDTDVQSVLDRVQLADGRSLRPVTSRAEWGDLGPLLLGGSREVDPGDPLFYFLETLGDPTEADSVRIRLHVAPAPGAAATLFVDVIKEPPYYTAADLCADPVPVPPVPHAYHESILRPLVRFGATSQSLFERHKELLPSLTRDYERALQLLGFSADPRKTSRANAPKVERTQESPR